MRYAVKPHVRNASVVDISADRYTELYRAREILMNGLAIEEQYEILVSSFLELEKTILASTADSMVRHFRGFEVFHKDRLAFAIRLMTLLTSARLYLDQLPRRVPACSPEIADPKERVESFRHHEYDNSKHYRFMEALRDHAQHRGVPVHWVQYGSRWTSMNDDALREYRIDFAAMKSELAKDFKIKPDVIEEMDERVNLPEAIRDYVECLSRIHSGVRVLVNRPLMNSRLLIRDALQEYGGDPKSSADVRSINDEEEEVESFPLMLQWDDLRISMEARNPELTNLTLRSVTTGKAKSARRSD